MLQEYADHVVQAYVDPGKYPWDGINKGGLNPSLGLTDGSLPLAHIPSLEETPSEPNLGTEEVSKGRPPWDLEKIVRHIRYEFSQHTS